jgi:hypothetical protein
MDCQLELAGRAWSFNTAEGIDISIPFRPYAEAQEKMSAFGLPPVEAPPATVGAWVGSVDQGGECLRPLARRESTQLENHLCSPIPASVNSPRLSLCCHGNGTHTECAAHVLPGRRTLVDAGVLIGPRAPPTLLPCVLITVTPVALGSVKDPYPPGQGDDLVVARAAVQDAVSGLEGAGVILRGGALAVRTTPNGEWKLSGAWPI